jgi:hypothetical protein
VSFVWTLAQHALVAGAPATVVGTPKRASTLRAGLPQWHCDGIAGGLVHPMITYQWLRDGVPITGATSASYTVPKNTPLQSRFRVRVHAARAWFRPATLTSPRTRPST